MIKIGSYAYCIDMTGVHFVKIFQVFGASYKRSASIGDVVYVVIKVVDTRAHYLRDDRIKFKFRKGSVHRAILVHVREKVRRYNRTLLWFLRNAVVLVNKQKIPFSKRIKVCGIQV